MGNPQNVVHALTALGLEELDAWRCVHLMQGRDSLVLLRLCGPGEPPAPEEPPGVDSNDIGDAMAHGAAWSRIGPHHWQYVRRVDWGMAALKQLHEDLERLAALDLTK